MAFLVRVDGEQKALDVELWVDHELKTVRLSMLELDSELLSKFLVSQLPNDFKVRVDDQHGELPKYGLEILLAGRNHPASLHHLAGGRISIYLGDPDSAYLARCERAIGQLLSALHSRRIQALVSGVDRYGRPEPSEGYLHLYARTQSAAHEEEVGQLCKEVEREHKVSVCSMCHFASASADFDRTIATAEHFAWDQDKRRVVLRNWRQS